jgi:rhamnogalacturonyl hydrolase YesR
MTTSNRLLELPACGSAAPGVAVSTGKYSASAERVAGWVERHGYKGYDPGDGLNSFLRPLAFGNRLAERVLLQLVWKSPINVRPLIGIQPMESTKARGYMAAGYLLRYRSTGQERYRVNAVACLEWLIANRAPGHEGYAWGNHFDFVTRSGSNPAGSPIIVWTALIGHAFLDGYEQLGVERYLDVARGACRWILALPRERTPTGSCLSYVPFAQSSIHNSNMLGAGLLARTWRHTGESELLDVARAAMAYSCARQREDGSWWYGEAPKHRWIDSFHTGYNLDSLKHYRDASGDPSFSPHFRAGLRYYAATFFAADGTPRYYHDRTHPVDIQCAAQGIETLAACADDLPGARDLACRVADWTIDHMQGRDGHFHFRRYPLVPARTPYIHWGQGTMYKALATLVAKLEGRAS